MVASPPLVSVIIPAYNAEAYIGEALASVLAQTHRHLEAVVVDDGSQDRTAEVVRAVMARDERVRLLQQPNQGVAAARNHGIKRSSGPYVAPLDADDVWYPEKLEVQLRRMEEGGDGMGMVYSWWVSLDEESRVMGGSTPWLIEGSTYERLLYVNFIGNASVPLFRRSALDRVGLYDASLRARGGQGCEDWDLSLRIAEHYEVGLAPGYLAGYRAVQGSMSFDCTSMGTSYELVMDEALQRQPDIPADLVRWSRGNFYTYLAHTSYAGQRHSDALRWVAKAVHADPLNLLARSTLRVGLRSVAWMAAQPITSRLWPERSDWIAFKKRVGLDRLIPTTREAIEAAAVPVPTPWQSGKPFDRIRTRRWRQIEEEATPEAATSSTPTVLHEA